MNYLIAKEEFHLKTFEYLLSGTPVISTRLNGYGPEYRDCMIFAEQDTPEGLAEAIDRMARMQENELADMVSRARDMVCSQKCWSVQTEKLLVFYNEW